MMCKANHLLAWGVTGILLAAGVVQADQPVQRQSVAIPLADFLLIALVASPVLWAEEIRKFLVRRRPAGRA